MTHSIEEIADLRICTGFSANPDISLPRSNRTKSNSAPGMGHLALPRLALWYSGAVLTVLFLGGAPLAHSEVKKYALEWNKHANIRLNFVNQGPADIRVSFVTGGSWSFVRSNNARPSKISQL